MQTCWTVVYRPGLDKVPRVKVEDRSVRPSSQHYISRNQGNMKQMQLAFEDTESNRDIASHARESILESLVVNVSPLFTKGPESVDFPPHHVMPVIAASSFRSFFPPTQETSRIARDFLTYPPESMLSLLARWTDALQEG